MAFSSVLFDVTQASPDLPNYGINLPRRVKVELPTCQLLIVLVREIQTMVQEAMQADADAVIFKSSLGTGKGDFVQAIQTLAEGGVYLTKEICQLGAAQAPNPNRRR